MDASAKKDIRLVIAAGVMGSLYFRLTAGAIPLLFITRCLKVPKADWALAAAFIPLTSVIHLVSAFVTERLRRRKLVSLSCFAIARLSTPAIMLVPFVTGETDTQIRVFYVAVALMARGICDALAMSGWLSWVADIVPQEHRGRYYSMRLALNTVAAALIPFLGAAVVDAFGKSNPTGYLLVFGFAFIIGEMDLFVHSFVADRPMPEHGEPARILPLLVAPWRHTGFRSLMVHRCLYVFGGGLISVFGVMYLDEVLDLTLAQIVGLSSLMLLVRTPALFVWRRIGDRVGYRTVAQIACTLAGVGVLYWWFLPADNFLVLFIVLILARAYFGVIGAGTTLAHSTLNMNVAPEKHRSAYFAQVTIITALATSLGIFCGRWVFVHLDPVTGGAFLGTRLSAVHVLVALTGLFRILSVRFFLRAIPDVKAEAAMPRIGRVLRTNALRIFPMLISLERPLTAQERAEHIDAMKELIPAPPESELERSLRTVLTDQVDAEEEFYRIVGRVRVTRDKGIARITREIAESAALHEDPRRARAAARRIERLFTEGDLRGCLRTVRRLAHQTADGWQSSMAASALSVIDGLAETAARPDLREEAVLLAIYAYLQIVREPAEGEP